MANGTKLSEAQSLGSKYREALNLGLSPGTPQFYEFMDLKAGKGAYTDVTPSKDIGLSDMFLDRMTMGSHLRGSRELRQAQLEADKIYGGLIGAHALEAQLDFRPGVQMPSPAQLAIQGAPGNIQQLAAQIRWPLDKQADYDESPLLARPSLPPPLRSAYAPSAPTIADLQMPTLGAPAIPPQPMKIGGYQTFDPQIQQLARTNLLQGPVTQDKIKAFKEVVPEFGEKPTVLSATDAAKQAVLMRAVKNEEWDEVRRIAGTLETEKPDSAAGKIKIITQAFDILGEAPDSQKRKDALLKLIEKEIAHPPAANQQVTVNQKTGESLAKEIGPMMAESRNSAIGAVQTVETAHRIGEAIKQGLVTLGPLASLRNKANQLTQLFGSGGATLEEKLVNTRNVIRGLAQFAVSARKALKGQGQVSDFEGKLLMKAEAGEIDDFTLPELKSFIAVTERLARMQYDQHQHNLKKMQGRDDLKDIAPFYEVPEMPTLKPWEKYKK